MNLHILIPHLFWPDASQINIYNALPVHHLEALLSKSASTINPPQEMETWLCRQFNIAQQQNNWPIAPIMLHLDAPDLAKASKDFWMRADPVHLRIEQNHIMLADSQAFQITENEAKELMQDLNNNLANYDCALLPLRPDRWYLRLAKIPDMQTYTLGQVTCKNINNFLPSGNDSIMWHKIFNEIQMLLHDHPVNLARESRGELIINSVWLWGGGKLPQSVRSPYTRIWSDDDFSHALASVSGTTYSHLPADAGEWLMTQPQGNHLMVLNSLRAKAQYRNAYDWREALAEMERHWFSPAHTALKEGKIDQLTITALDGTATRNFTLTRSSLWKFWRMTKPLSIYTEKHQPDYE
ncbi:MAG: phosphoglycerate mutase [Gammaproteobacteria bacterium]|nr:MAG: phosphoglycerate mutase [Gammaproteobacteria bacterium]